MSRLGYVFRWCRIALSSAALLLFGAEALAAELLDPTRPPDAQDTTVPEQHAPRLQSVVIRGAEQRVAVIDGYIRRPGDTWSGNRLVKIEADQVLVVHAGRKTWLRLTGPVDLSISERVR
ncbi:MAG: hypothetical protein AAF529_10110 [Pseudomonadota bacterium]